MIQLSTPWTTPQDPARVAIERTPLLAGLLPRLDAVHKAIFAVQASQEDPRARTLSEAEAETDAVHDGLVRGIYGALSTLAELSPSAEELLRLRDMLLPEGLEHTRKTYRGEAGHAAMVSARLDDSVRARLKSVTLHDKNLLDLVDTWLASALKLGQLEEERARLAAPSGSGAGQINDARLGWVRVVNALLANAELAELDEATDRLLFAGLRAAERTADGRRRGRATGVGTGTGVAPVPVVGGPTPPTEGSGNGRAA